MDEKQLGALFRAAPGEPPPPTFGLADVTAKSARTTVRRRSALILAVGCAILFVVGFGLTRAGFPTDTTPGPASVGTGGQPGDASGRLPYASTPSPLQGSGGTGEDGPRAEGTQGCDKVDRELATALAGELPATGVTGPSPGHVCTTGSRSAGFRVTDGDRTGFVSVALVPSGITFPSAASEVTVQEKAASGGTIVVSSAPDTGSSPPLQGELRGIALTLAGRF
jgi:hypothetical protein